ncbi:phosphatidylinositol-binding clathrin assembly protein-like [Dipodomys spectabilis]|uniref:phosphatidylinositol-binding clathrin assembly protein-like n=1 Tax=Dipodomys spectabilis TaxID=105255 RepID=UPI001C5441DC|nr:phosphatidylinositol-binding clathrin assembly protein-like [Dipodomys spectabilis]
MGLSASKAALGATTEEPTEPERKHLSSLVKYINGTNMNAERPFNILLEKTGNCSWVVVFKALITVHHLMIHGNERFIRHVASRNSLFTLHNFLDKGVPEGPTMSTFIRRYSRYLNEKSLVYRLIAYDITKSKRGTDGVMRTMNTKKLLNILPVIQTQFDALLNFNASPNEITNGIVRAAFMLLFKDCLRLFAAYNEGILNLLGKYFDMRKNQCNQSLDIYIAFLARTTRLAQFLKVAEEVGIHQSNIPYLTQAPHSLIEALKQHLASLEDKNDILPPYSLQHTFIPLIPKSPVVEISASRVLFSGLNFGESPVNETDMNQHQVSEKEMIDGMTWQLNTCTCTSSIWDSISAPSMVKTYAV